MTLTTRHFQCPTCYIFRPIGIKTQWSILYPLFLPTSLALQHVLVSLFVQTDQPEPAYLPPAVSLTTNLLEKNKISLSKQEIGSSWTVYGLAANQRSPPPPTAWRSQPELR